MLKEIQPTNILDPKWLETYNKERDVIAMQLTQLNSNLFIMERVEEFPFRVLLIETHPFWDLTRIALAQASISIIYRVVLDKRRDVLTLSRFHKHVKANLRSDLSTTDKQEVEGYLSRFEQEIKPYRVKVERIRHNTVAHLNYDTNTKANPMEIPVSPVNLVELKELAGTACDLFNDLCFGFGWHTWFGGYGSSSATKRETDIDELLTMVASNNRMLNMPEEQLWLWEIYRKEFSPERLKVFNELRRRCGKPEV